MLQGIHATYPVLAICVERSFRNSGLIVSVAYKTSNYTWACKTGSGFSRYVSESKLVNDVLKYGMSLDKEITLDTFNIKKLEYRYDS
jgi:hypothetical protein